MEGRAPWLSRNASARGLVFVMDACDSAERERRRPSAFDFCSEKFAKRLGRRTALIERRWGRRGLRRSEVARGDRGDQTHCGCRTIETARCRPDFASAPTKWSRRREVHPAGGRCRARGRLRASENHPGTQAASRGDVRAGRSIAHVRWRSRVARSQARARARVRRTADGTAEV